MDLLLANVLLGLVLVTAALAVAQSICSAAFMLRPQLSPKNRLWCRIAVMTAMCGLSLWLFAQQGGDYSEERSGEFGLVELVERHASEPHAQVALSPATVTTLAATRLDAAIKVTERMATNVTPSSADICQTWERALKDWGATRTEHYAAAELLLICVHEPLTEALLRRLSEGDLKDKQTLFVGPVHRSNAPYLSRLLTTDGWMEGRPSEDYAVGLRRAPTNQVPAGLRLHLGHFPRDTEHHHFAKSAAGDAFLIDSNLRRFRSSPYAALVSKDRRAWTSLPPKLYGVNDLLYASAWKVLWADVFRRLHKEPRVAVHPLDDAADSPVVMNFAIDRKGLPFDALLRFCKSSGFVANFYVNPSFIEEYEAALRRAMKDGHGVGVLVNRHPDMGLLQSMLSGALARLNGFEKDVAQSFGALVTNEGFSAMAVGILKENGFHHAINDGHTDRLTPYEVMEFQGAVPPSGRSLPHSHGMHMIPLSGGVRSSADVTLLSAEMQLAADLGGPYVVAMNLGPDNLPHIQKMMRELARNGGQFISSVTLVQRQASVDAITIDVSQSGQVWKVRVTNEVGNSSQDVRVVVDEDWTLSADSNQTTEAQKFESVIAVKALNPGESRVLQVNRKGSGG